LAICWYSFLKGSRLPGTKATLSSVTDLCLSALGGLLNR
jgi:hypothetical protein